MFLGLIALILEPVEMDEVMLKMGWSSMVQARMLAQHLIIKAEFLINQIKLFCFPFPPEWHQKTTCVISCI